MDQYERHLTEEMNKTVRVHLAENPGGFPSDALKVICHREFARSFESSDISERRVEVIRDSLISAIEGAIYQSFPPEHRRNYAEQVVGEVMTEIQAVVQQVISESGDENNV